MTISKMPIERKTAVGSSRFTNASLAAGYGSGDRPDTYKRHVSTDAPKPKSKKRADSHVPSPEESGPFTLTSRTHAPYIASPF